MRLFRIAVSVGVLLLAACTSNTPATSCAKDAVCAAPTSLCKAATCNAAGQCETTNEPAETACIDNDGTVCDGDGKCVPCVVAADCFTSDSACYAPTCASNNCSSMAAPAGTACSNDNGTVCNGFGTCISSHCNDNVIDADESGVDCGGADCNKCTDGLGCNAPSDCNSNLCLAHVCSEPSCGDGVVERSSGEQCDQGAANGTAGDGCSASCQLIGNYINESEPDDTIDEATFLGTLDVVGDLDPAGDVDWYEVDAVVDHSSLTAYIDDGLGNCPLGFDSRLSLYDKATMTLLATDSGGGISPCSRISPQMYAVVRDLPAAPYALEVESVSGAAQPYYVLSFVMQRPECGDGIVQSGEQCDPGPTQVTGCSATCQLTGDLIPEVEPNDTQATANPIGVHAGFIGAINPTGDQDFYSFTVPGPSSSVTIRVSDGIGGCPFGFDSELTLFDANGAQLIQDDNGGIDGCSQISPELYTQASSLTAGTYRARVQYNGNSHTASLYVVTIAVQ